MNALNIIESIYSGEPYTVAEKVMVDPSEVNLAFKYSSMRFKNKTKVVNSLPVEPYSIDYTKYSDMLSRTILRVGEWNPIEIGLYSKPEEFEFFVNKYDKAKAVLTEPLKIADLMYDSTHLSPLGLMALMFRKHYDNEDFKRYINSTLLKEYRKEKIWIDGVGHSLYIKDNYQDRVKMVRDLEASFNSDRSWKFVEDVMVQSPYIFIWRS